MLVFDPGARFVFAERSPFGISSLGWKEQAVDNVDGQNPAPDVVGPFAVALLT